MLSIYFNERDGFEALFLELQRFCLQEIFHRPIVKAFIDFNGNRFSGAFVSAKSPQCERGPTQNQLSPQDAHLIINLKSRYRVFSALWKGSGKHANVS